LAGLGFFAKELNVGWEEWSERKYPVHSGRIPAGELRCTCSVSLTVVEEAGARP
jgi:hypothetical protein